jgi:hypothetical protein
MAAVRARIMAPVAAYGLAGAAVLRVPAAVLHRRGYADRARRGRDDLYAGALARGQLSGLEFFFAILHLVSAGLVAWPLLRVATRFFGHVALTDQVLALAIAGGVTAYLVTTESRQGAHEIALIEPFAAALAARTLAGPASLAEAAARSGIVTLAGTARRVLTAGYLAGALVLAGYTAGLGYPDWPMSRIVGCFGRPDRVYHTGPYTVLVWRHNLLRSIPR